MTDSQSSLTEITRVGLSDRKMAGASRRGTRSKHPSSSSDKNDDPSIRNVKPNTRILKSGGRDRNFIRILNVNLKYLFIFGLVCFLIALFLVNYLINPAEEPVIPRVVTPFPAPKLMELTMVKIVFFCFLDST